MNSLSTHLCTLHHHRKCLFKKKSILSFKYKMRPGLVAKTCLSQKAVHSDSNSAPVQVTIPILLSLFTAFLDPPSSLPDPPPPLLNYSATIAAGPGPSIRSAQGEGWWLTVCNRVHLDSYRPLELRRTTVLEPLGRIWLMLWGVFGCEVALTVKIYELLAAFSLLGELGEEEEEEEGEKFIPDSPGGSVAVFWPLRLFLHTGHVSCCQKQREKEYFQYSLQKGDIPL